MCGPTSPRRISGAKIISTTTKMTTPQVGGTHALLICFQQPLPQGNASQHSTLKATNQLALPELRITDTDTRRKKKAAVGWLTHLTVEAEGT